MNITTLQKLAIACCIATVATNNADAGQSPLISGTYFRISDRGESICSAEKCVSPPNAIPKMTIYNTGQAFHVMSELRDALSRACCETRRIDGYNPFAKSKANLMASSTRTFDSLSKGGLAAWTEPSAPTMALIRKTYEENISFSLESVDPKRRYATSISIDTLTRVLADTFSEIVDRMSAEDVFKRAHALPSQAIVIVDPMNPFMSPEAIDIVCDDAAVRKNAKFLIEEIVRSNKLDECCDLKHFKQLVSEITNSTELVISSYVGVPGGQLSLINKMAQNVDEIYRLAMEYKEPGRLFKNPHKRLNNAVIAQKIKLLAVEIAASM